MSDLFDDARPVRDATLAELERVLAHESDLSSFIKDGNRLGCHLTALLMTFVMKRLDGRSGEIEADGLQDLLVIAISETIAYVCCAFRPVRNGVPFTPLETLHQFAAKLGRYAEHKVMIAQAGLQDFVIPFHYRDGQIEQAEAFDVMDMLKESKP